MKGTVLLILAIFIVACSKDEVTTKECNCVKLMQSRTTTINSLGQTISVTSWSAFGVGQVSTDIKDCSQDGKVVYKGLQSGQNKLVEYRHILKCN
jgi:hypothetical protein